LRWLRLNISTAIAPSIRTGATMDDPDPTPQSEGGNGRESRDSRTIDDDSIQSSNGAGEYHPARISREVAEHMDPDLLRRYY